MLGTTPGSGEVEMAMNTLHPDVERIVSRVDPDLVQRHPASARRRERRPAPTMPADAVTFFVSSATRYAVPTPAHTRTGVAGPFAALSRDLEELVSPQYQAINPDIGATASHGAAASAPDARREPSTPAAPISRAFLLAGWRRPAARCPNKILLRRIELPTWYQAAHLQYLLSHAVVDEDYQPTRVGTISIASHPTCWAPISRSTSGHRSTSRSLSGNRR